MKKLSVISVLAFLTIVILGCWVVTLLYGGRNKNENGDDQIVVGAVYMTMNNPYFEVLSEEIRTYVVGKDDLYIARDSALDADVQLEQIESFIDSGVDILIINPVDWIQIKTGLEEAKKAGIPVIVVDTPVYDEDLATTSIYSDNMTCGIFCAQDLMQRMDRANILFLIHSGNKASSDRIQGFKETLDEKQWDYTVVGELECDGQLENAQPVVEEFLKTTHSKVDVIMALNDPSALGAMAAFNAAGAFDDVLVYGVDGAPAAKTMIYEGKMTATVAQSPMKVGEYAADYIYKILDGVKVPKKKIVEVNLITSDNIDDYSLTGWQ